MRFLFSGVAAGTVVDRSRHGGWKVETQPSVGVARVV